MAHHGTETDFELTTIQRFEHQGYRYVFGMEIERPHHEVVLKDVLRSHLAARYRDLPATALDEAIHIIAAPHGVDTLRRNLAFHQLLTRGFDLKVEFAGVYGGKTEYRHIYPINWDEPTKNDFRIINQFPIHGQNDRRPDVIVFINGLPLVLFELKNPYSEKPTVDEAFNQIQHYTFEIPQVFDFNALTVISDGITTLHGVWTGTREWYSPWKSIDGFEIEPNTTGSMKTLVEGLFPKDRLLQYIRDFLVFEVVNEKITKKGARYHQFFAVRLAVQKTLETYARRSPDRRIGVIWHTTGSGKSLSMAFLVGILRRRTELENPIFVIEVDRNDLDKQLYDQFLAASQLVGEVKQADSVNDLRDLLQTSGGEVIFTTIEKFRLGEGETEHPVLNSRSNIILIADEAHRSQYGFADGFARSLGEALPNAMRLGFTGTPVSMSGADTVQVFGDLIHIYDIQQSQRDGATVPIYYEPRQLRLFQRNPNLETHFRSVVAGQNPNNINQNIGRWTALAAITRSAEHVATLAQDIFEHFTERTRTLKRRKVREEDLEPFIGSILLQAQALYADWPLSEYSE